MKNHVLLTTTSVLSVALFVMHLTHDILRGIEPGNRQTLTGCVVICVVWLCGALLLAERRWGQAIMLVGAILAAGVPFLHMQGAGVGATAVKSPGAFPGVATLLALGVNGSFSLILAVRALLARRPDGKMASAAHEDPDRRG